MKKTAYKKPPEYGVPALRFPVPPGASEKLWHAFLQTLGPLTEAAELEVSIDHDGQVRALHHATHARRRRRADHPVHVGAGAMNRCPARTIVRYFNSRSAEGHLVHTFGWLYCERPEGHEELGHLSKLPEAAGKDAGAYMLWLEQP